MLKRSRRLPNYQPLRNRRLDQKRRLVLALLLAATPVAASAVEVAMAADAAFAKASRVLVNLGALPTFRDKELLVIKTDPAPLKDVPSQADCGTMFGIPYVKDKRTKVAATYQLSIKPVGDARSDVSLTVTLDGYMDVNEGAPFFVDKTRDKNKVLNCKSTGTLEGKFFELLSEP
jgi:hypothetical protein